MWWNCKACGGIWRAYVEDIWDIGLRNLVKLFKHWFLKVWDVKFQNQWLNMPYNFAMLYSYIHILFCIFVTHRPVHCLFFCHVALEPPSSKPLFVTRLSPEMGVLSGEPVLLKCKVGGYPPPKTAWFKDGIQLRNEPPYEITSKAGEHSLQIPKSGIADSGAYTCIATNPSGQDQTACNLSVTGV